MRRIGKIAATAALVPSLLGITKACGAPHSSGPACGQTAAWAPPPAQPQNAVYAFHCVNGAMGDFRSPYGSWAMGFETNDSILSAAPSRGWYASQTLLQYPGLTDHFYAGMNITVCKIGRLLWFRPFLRTSTPNTRPVELTYTGPARRILCTAAMVSGGV